MCCVLNLMIDVIFMVGIVVGVGVFCRVVDDGLDIDARE